MIRPFIIDHQVKMELESLKEYAEANPLTIDNLLDMFNGAIPPAGDTKEYSRLLPFGFKVVLTIMPDSHGTLYRQMSMSVSNGQRIWPPNPHVVDLILPFLGFTKSLSDCVTDIEITEIGQAVIVIEK